MSGPKILRRFKIAKVSVKNLTSNVNYEVEQSQDDVDIDTMLDWLMQ